MATAPRKKTSTTTRKKASTKATTPRAADRADKSVEDFRDALERSVTISRERIQEVVDDSVKRGRMTRDDANEMVSKLLSRGRRQTEDLIAELERLLENARGEVGDRAKAARVGVEKGTTKTRARVDKAAGRAAKGALDAADAPLARVDKLRRKAGVGPGFPILAYDDLSVSQVRNRLGDLGRPELRKVRTYEQNNKARKGILGDIERKLA